MDVVLFQICRDYGLPNDSFSRYIRHKISVYVGYVHYIPASSYPPYSLQVERKADGLYTPYYIALDDGQVLTIFTRVSLCEYCLKNRFALGRWCYLCEKAVARLAEHE